MTPIRTVDELEKTYCERPDPWGYQTSPADIERKGRILRACSEANDNKTYGRALDIACGEGWITGALPAEDIHGYEVSESARRRVPMFVSLAGSPQFITGFFDLVLCSGALYEHYDWQELVRIMRAHAAKVIVTSSIETLEHEPAIEEIKCIFPQVYSERFPYNRPEARYTQVLRVFKK